MPLSQLLITLDSFQSLPLAGATLLKRDGIWAELRAGGWGGGGLPGGGGCADPRGPQSAVPSLAEERCPKET